MINNFKNNVLSTYEKMKNNEYHEGMENLYYSSYLFLIASLYAVYNKLYISAILVFYLFITSVVHWNDYNNKFKLCGDYYMVSIILFYSVYTLFKIKNYLVLLSLLLILGLYFISFHYTFKQNYIVASNVWIFAHCLGAMTFIYLFNRLKIYNKEMK
tara:strand:- start:941 stop:1411 length:471 start_codon:yes stop_codon:yes gene_type:complete